MPHLFLNLSIILAVTTVLGIIARKLKQPLIVAYIFAGILISIFTVFEGVNQELFEFFSNLGIAFLLFLVGIELKVDDLKYVGKAAILTGIGQIIFTALVGFVIINTLGFSVIPSIYIAFALTFSSTVIIIKLLTEKHDLQSLYGKITVGYLLVQDFIAILALMLLSGFGNGHAPSLTTILLILAKGLLLVIFTYLAARFVLKTLFRLTSVSVELLFVSAIAWAFLLSAIAESSGFSIAIGAFLAGVAIASSPYRIQISARIKPLRDFFVVIFFIVLGASLSGGTAFLNVPHAIFLSLFVLVGNPLIVIAIMLTLGFRNRTSFLVSVTVAQISEFSLILMAVGRSLGHVTSSEVALVAAVGVVTITMSSYLILYGDKIYKFVSPLMAKLFPEKNRDPYVANRQNLKDHVVLVGAEQMGSDILKFLSSKIKDRNLIVVVDFNPEIYKSVRAEGYNAVFGDITDPEVLEELELGRAKLLVITDSDEGDNYQLIKFARDKNFRGPIVSTSYWMHDAIKIYEAGADYVVVPELVGGKHASKILAEHWEDLRELKKEKSKHFEDLISRKIF
ncbi:MAG: Transporter, CPA2 family [Candidatus Curtissbacteria bacterium GW2011_GWA1_41_11]|uniref:Transporter, CPA2 family n=1 Tax=Candidatus Curtissbacteria bacterium GW2011_GWA1_41_11 TaxID=1618409 RepID=A0A0G0WRC3_9BACT|nr:MAG: Transporter, CPA2 family [Candidatus Curtissbacteria bacterium GW2011_GWA1_41_11]